MIVFRHPLVLLLLLLVPALALAASGLALTGCVVAPAYPGDVVYGPARRRRCRPR